MAVKNLVLQDFRNYKKIQLGFSSGITVLTGKNGIGKTTILEAISLLGNSRTFRPGKNVDMIRKGTEIATIRSNFFSEGLEHDLETKIYPQGKKVFHNEKLIKNARILGDLLPTIIFSPSDHRIIEGDSSDRKSFLNRAISLMDWEYYEELTQYNRALLQRNRLLKELGKHPSNRALEALAPWTIQVAHLGARLMIRRSAYISELQEWAQKEYQRISQQEDIFLPEYQPLGAEQKFDLFLADEMEKNLLKLMEDSLRLDLLTSSTQVGVHKDEILLTLNGNKVKFYGSQGEKRTAALALRLAELALFVEKKKRVPVLLFDDVSSELDSARRKSLVDLLKEEKTQVLITATELPNSLLGDVGRAFEQFDLNSLGDRI